MAETNGQTAKKITDFTFDERNANRGTERGNYMLERSLEKFGAGRSILVDKEGRVIAGNKTLAKAGELGIEDVIVVQTDGTKIVAVQRMDLDLAKDDRARELAFADNRVSEVDLEWDLEQISRDLVCGLDLSDFWKEDELAALIDSVNPDWSEAETDRLTNSKDDQFIRPVIRVLDVDIVERALSKTGEINRGEAFLVVCRAYLGEK